MRIAWWPHTRDNSVASFRLRCEQIHQQLMQRGVESSFYEPGARPPDVLILSKRYDERALVHLRQLAAARSQVTVGPAQGRAAPRLLLDLCDNHFHFDADPRGQLQARADRLRDCIDLVDHVVTASDALADELLRRHPRASVTVIPDAAELPSDRTWPTRLTHLADELALRRLARWHERQAKVPHTRRLVWFGNHGSPGVDGGMQDVEPLMAQLEKTRSAHAPTSLTIISNNRSSYDALVRNTQIATAYLPWAARTFSRALRLHSTAVIPVGLNAFTRCKTANRVLTAYLHGLNVVADRIPSYEPFPDCAVLGDWQVGLDDYLDDLALRRRHLHIGQTLASRDFALGRTVDRWQTCLAGLLASG